MEDSSPAATLPFAFDLWYPIVCGPLHCRTSVEVDASDARERVQAAWDELAPGESLLLVDRDGRGLVRGLLARVLRRSRIRSASAGLEGLARTERFHVLPNTGGTWVLLPAEPEAATTAGLTLLPAGRARWRLARRLLQRAGRTRRFLLDGLDQVALVVKAGEEKRSTSRPTPFHVTAGRSSVAVACGVPGRFQKLVARITDEHGAARAFLKMSKTADARERVRREGDTLIRLGERGLAHVGPGLLDRGDHGGVQFLVLEPLGGRRASDTIGREHVGLLEEMQRVTQDTCTLPTLAPFVGARRELARLAAECVPSAAPQFKALEALARAIVRRAGAQGVTCALAHGDFTPWNLTVTDGVALAFDWEQMIERAPALYDLVHFHVQAGVLVRRASAERILDGIEADLHGPALELATTAHITDDWPVFAGLYLLIHTTREEADYRVHPPPFQQIEWLRAAREALALLLTARIEELPARARREGEAQHRSETRRGGRAA